MWVRSFPRYSKNEWFGSIGKLMKANYIEQRLNILKIFHSRKKTTGRVLTSMYISDSKYPKLFKVISKVWKYLLTLPRVPWVLLFLTEDGQTLSSFTHIWFASAYKICFSHLIWLKTTAKNIALTNEIEANISEILNVFECAHLRCL